MGKRIDYIDYLKGLSIMWVVWFHAIHPAFVGFSFRMPLFFLASGIFFKIVSLKTYAIKKTNQLLVPFLFFYILYYIFLIFLNAASNKSFVGFDYGCIWGVFRAYKYNYTFVVDPPLWFICALFVMQITTWILVKLLRKKWIIALAALALTCVGIKYLWATPTYFSFGRSMQYLVYYVFGHLYGKQLIKIVDSGKRSSLIPLFLSAIVFAVSIVLKDYLPLLEITLTYIETFALIILLIYVFKFIHTFRWARPFWFYGRNSFIVLGIHEVYLTTLTVIWKHAGWHIGVWDGAIMTITTLLLLWPTIMFMNKHIPALVGKGEVLKLKGNE